MSRLRDSSHNKLHSLIKLYMIPQFQSPKISPTNHAIYPLSPKTAAIRLQPSDHYGLTPLLDDVLSWVWYWYDVMDIYFPCFPTCHDHISSEVNFVGVGWAFLSGPNSIMLVLLFSAVVVSIYIRRIISNYLRIIYLIFFILIRLQRLRSFNVNFKNKI